MQRRNATNDFLNFYFGRAVRHFREEEELFFAAVTDEPSAHDLILQAVTDHLRLHGLARILKRQLAKGEADRDVLTEISRI